MDVGLRHFRAAVTVARVANFTRAAEVLYVAQPSLSQTIHQLETHLGFRIFNRTTRSVSVTAEGELFLAEATAVLDQFEASMGRIAKLRAGEAGSLRIGYLIGAAVEFLPQILRHFAADYPAVKMEVLEFDFSTPNAGLDTGETDIAIVRPPIARLPGSHSMVLLTENCLACVPNNHQFATLQSIPLQDLLLEPIVAAPGSSEWRDYWLLNSLRTQPPKVAYEAATFEAELQAVAFGHGISVVPATVARYFPRPGVRFVPIAGTSTCEVSVVWRGDSPASAANFARLARGVITQKSRVDQASPPRAPVLPAVSD